MVPVNLKLSNFTSYGVDVPELNFTNFHLAAISGSNGAGKSSLLDSITWCLWGLSRLGDSADQLIRLGQNEMLVEFTFELDGQQLTVKRKRGLKSGGTTTLELLSKSHNLTEGTIKATQQKIIDTLHLSYETFVNSAFIRQGHADEFTTKGATDRKRILADILGLSDYDKLEEKAKEKAKESQTKIQLLDYQLLEIEAELSLKEERQKILIQAENESKESERQLKEVEQLIKVIEAEKETIITKLQSLDEKQQRLQNAQQELEDLKLQIDLKVKSQDEYQTILNQKEEIEKNCQILSSLKDKKKELDDKRSKLLEVKNELALLQKQIISLEDRRNKKITELEVEIKKLETENKSLQDQLDHLKSHKDTCPTCKQPIGEDKNKQMLSLNLDTITKNNGLIKDTKEKLDKCQKYILPESKQSEQKEAAVKKLEAETKDYHSISEQIQDLLKYETLNLKLQQAQTAITSHLESILDLKKIYQSKEEQIKKEEGDLKDLNLFQTQLQEVKIKLTAQETIKEDLSQKTLNLRGQVGSAKQLVDRATQLEELFQKKSQEKGKLKSEKDIYEELSLAFGKKGIQAMIIESAIPEVEGEANRLLDKLSDGRMKVRFDTQKETKVGTTIETLDIIISDEMGERSYEAFSGGEQFRVNLAIRLALSKLLTNRAGAKLQFLVIDEGFGTQDVQGRSKIVEALNIIKDEFAKILVITHLEELKEEFPVRIEVEKGVMGSSFKVVGI